MSVKWNPEMFANHRERLFEALGDDDAVLLFGAPHHLRNGDAEFKYRPDSDVYHLTGWDAPDVAVLLRPKADQRFVMFVQKRDPDMEIWTGRRWGPKGRRVASVRMRPTNTRSRRKAARTAPGVPDLHYRVADDADRDRLLMGALKSARRKARRNGLDVPDAFIDPSRVLHELRLLKTDHEISVMKKAAEITCNAHIAAMGITAPGVTEFELESVIEHTFRTQGGNGPGYTSIVGSGPNATILHYIENSDAMKDGHLVCVDAGCEYGFYTADVTRTWPVNGTFTKPQAALYQAVLDAQEAAIAQAVGGTRCGRTPSHRSRLDGGNGSARLLRGEVDDLIADESYRRYYMHGTSHWLGLDVHDVGAYFKAGDSRALEPGMVLTIEPGIYVAEDDEEAPEAYRGIGIRIEDDVLITADGNDVLTAAVPKSIAEVEAAVRARS